MTFLDQKRPDMQTWTDERVELLKKLWADGLSASQIAGELGGITRNAVIGKVHRLGLSGRAKAPSSSVPRQRKPRAPSMFRARPMMRGNTALAHMPRIIGRGARNSRVRAACAGAVPMRREPSRVRKDPGGAPCRSRRCV